MQNHYYRTGRAIYYLPHRLICTSRGCFSTPPRLKKKKKKQRRKRHHPRKRRASLRVGKSLVICQISKNPYRSPTHERPSVLLAKKANFDRNRKLASIFPRARSRRKRRARSSTGLPVAHEVWYACWRTLAGAPRSGFAQSCGARNRSPCR